MEEANKKCARIKQVYENCFRNWYSEEFLKGNLAPACQDEFEEYRECVLKVIKKIDSINIPKQYVPAASQPPSTSS